MKQEDRNLKTIMRGTLRKPTLEENIEEIDNRIFMMEMSDRLDDETWNIIKVLKEIKKELEEELKCKTSK